MKDLLHKIENYWDDRSTGYCEVNLEELSSFKRKAWADLIKRYAPDSPQKKLKVLDVGTGPGFFAIIMAECGFDVTAIDYTEAMIETAKRNAKQHLEDSVNDINFCKMDAHHLEFEADTFDLIITRNLTWNLERPKEAYRDWHRVLANKGRLLNFDANWYLHVHDPKMREAYEQDRCNTSAQNLEDHYTSTDTDEMEAIAARLPLSKIVRPQWDVNELISIGFNKIMIDLEVGNRVWDDVEKVNYGSTPMFMIGAEK